VQDRSLRTQRFSPNVVQPLVGGGVSGPRGRSFRPWMNFPAQGTGNFAQALAVLTVFSPWWGPEFSVPVGRSFRPWPEFPAARAGVSGLGFGCNGYNFEGV